MKKIYIKFFSKYKDLTKKDEITLILDDNYSNFNDLISKLMEIFQINFNDLVFNENQTIKSDLIVLKNDRDFSILSEEEKILKNNDILVFISPIHGG